MAAGPIPHWPGRMVCLTGGERVWLAEAGRSVRDDHAVGEDAVLCVHGMAGAATNWTDFMAELAGEFSCAAVDLPGSGFSPPPATPAGYSVPALARTVARVIEDHFPGPAHLVGNSMGGAVALKLAAARPDLLRTLTLISPALPDLVLRSSLVQFPVLALPRIGAMLMRRAGLLSAEHRVAAVARGCFYDPGVIHPDRFAFEVAELRRRDQLGYADAAIVGAARAMTLEYLRPRSRSLWRDAERVRVPVLAIYGSHDKLVHPRGAARAAGAFRAAPDARVLVLPRTGHVAQMEYPGLVADHFREMVRRARGMPERARGLSRERKSPHLGGTGVAPREITAWELVQCRCHRWLSRPPGCRSTR
ncbi:MAG: alpha/beta fold hydrolase [Nocardiopsaceae bacterium]|nr:alpha/beta fold hydrolase [Nocardiopsaceae bacterium]